MKKNNLKSSTSKTIIKQETHAKFALVSANLKLMVVGFAIILLGFILMYGGGTPPEQFDAEALYGFQRITLAPILVVGGFVFQIFAIFYRPKSK